MIEHSAFKCAHSRFYVVGGIPLHVVVFTSSSHVTCDNWFRYLKYYFGHSECFYWRDFPPELSSPFWSLLTSRFPPELCV